LALSAAEIHLIGIRLLVMMTIYYRFPGVSFTAFIVFWLQSLMV